MRIALISPYWVMRNGYPPLGLGYLSAMLESRGHDVRIFDFTLFPAQSLSRQLAAVREFSPQAVGVSITTNAYASAKEFIRALKETLPQVPVIVGGPHPSLFPQEVLRENPGVDFVVQGEGEHVLPELCEAIERNAECRSIPGVGMRDAQGAAVCNGPRPLLEELDTLPFPSRILFAPQEEYRNAVSVTGNPMATILSSRGCPFSCSYCYKGIFGNRYRKRSVENILREIEGVVQGSGISSFWFIDDLFTFDQQRVREFCAALRARGLRIEWECLSRVHLVSPELLKEMKSAGCSRVFFGIESGNQRIISQTKGITLEQVRSAVRWAKEAGIYSTGYFMLGLPGDTKETMEETIRFAESLDIESVMFSVTTPFPGTRLWEVLQQKQQGPDMAHFDHAFYHGCLDEVFLNISDASDKELLAAYKRAKQLTEDTRLKAFLRRRFGSVAGNAFYPFLRYAGRIAPLRAAGKMILRGN